MSPSSLADPITHQRSHPVTALCKRWNITPADLKSGLILWTLWTGATWLAFALSLMFVEVGETGEVSWIKATVGGCLIAASQWLVLRPYLHRATRWLAVTSTVWALLCLLHLGAIGWVVPSTQNLLLRSMFGMLYGSYVGVGLGLGQWWALKSQVHRAWRWIPLNAGIWAVGIAIAWVSGGLLRSTSGLFLGEVIGLMLGWMAIAALSGLGMVSLLQTQAEHPTQPADSRAFAAAKSNASGSKSPY